MSPLLEDLKDSIYAIYDGAHICTQPNDPFTLEPRDSSMVHCLGSSVMLFNLGVFSPR
jgi:hypothetical protein